MQLELHTVHQLLAIRWEIARWLPHWLLEEVTAGGRGVVRASSSAAGVVGLQSAGESSGVVAVVAE